jgi:hypothetical protein
MQEAIAVINKGCEIFCSNDRNWERRWIVKRGIETLLQPYCNLLSEKKKTRHLLYRFYSSKFSFFFLNIIILNIIQFSIRKFHKMKNCSSILCWLLKILERNLMYLLMFPLYFCFNLRRFILRRKSQEPNPGVNRVLPVFTYRTAYSNCV